MFQVHCLQDEDHMFCLQITWAVIARSKFHNRQSAGLIWSECRLKGSFLCQHVQADFVEPAINKLIQCSMCGFQWCSKSSSSKKLERMLMHHWSARDSVGHVCLLLARRPRTLETSSNASSAKTVVKIHSNLMSRN